LWVYLLRISPYLRSGPGKIFIFFENILYNIFLFKKYFFAQYFFSTYFFMQVKVRTKLFFANRGSETAGIRQISQTKTKPCKIGPIRQKSARNWESARNSFCLPANFQIRQNFPNLAEKTAIWQRWNAKIRPT
jgi:hypothetical protein